jgi:hypothetical protein
MTFVLSFINFKNTHTYFTKCYRCETSTVSQTFFTNKNLKQIFSLPHEPSCLEYLHLTLKNSYCLWD